MRRFRTRPACPYALVSDSRSVPGAEVVRAQRAQGIQLLVAISLAAAALGVAIVALVRTL